MADTRQRLTVTQRAARLDALAGDEWGTPAGRLRANLADMRGLYCTRIGEGMHWFQRHAGDLGAVFAVKGSRGWHGRWMEKAAGCDCFGWEGWADSILALRHTGWLVDARGWGDEAWRGAVLRLPNRRGFVAAAADPWRDGRDEWETAGMVLDCHASGSPVVYDCEREAARAADRLAELLGEVAREESARFEACAQIECAGEDLAAIRGEVRGVVRELRAGAELPLAVCASLRARMDDLRERRADLIRRIECLRENPWAAVEG